MVLFILQVGPVPEHQALDEFQLRLIDGSRPNSAPSQITMELYVPNLEDSDPKEDTSKDQPAAVDPNKPQRKGMPLSTNNKSNTNNTTTSNNNNYYYYNANTITNNNNNNQINYIWT